MYVGMYYVYVCMYYVSVCMYASIYLYRHAVIYVCTHPPRPQDYLLSDTTARTPYLANTDCTEQSTLTGSNRSSVKVSLASYRNRVFIKPATLFCPVPDNSFLNTKPIYFFKPLNPELNPICYLLALLGAHHFLHVSRIRVRLLTFGLLMSYIYGAPILDVSRSHTTTQHTR